MKCSRITLLLALMVLGRVAAARATDDLTAYPLSKADVLRLLYLDIVRPAEWFESATDWRGNDKPTDGYDDTLYTVDSQNNAADKERASGQSLLEDDGSSGSKYSGYYGNDAAAAAEMKDSRGEQTAKSGGSKAIEATDEPNADDEDGETDPSTPPSVDDNADRANTAQQSDSEESMIQVESDDQAVPADDDLKTDAQQTTPVEPSTHETAPDGDAELLEGYGVEFVYSVPQAKFANRVEVAAVCCSMMSRLGSLAVLSGDDLRAVAGTVLQRIVEIDWDGFLGGKSTAGSREETLSDMEEAYR